MKKNTSIFKLGLAIAACFLIGAMFAHAVGLAQYSALFGFGVTAMGMAPRTSGALFMATPDTTAIAGCAGKYEKALFRTLREKLSIFNDITVYPGIKNRVKLTKLTVKDGVRGYREDFDAADDDLSYSGRDLDVELLKRDFKINPLKYRTTWMSEVMKPGVNPEDIPFAQFVNESQAKQIGKEINKGSYLAVKGDFSTLAKSFDGLGTIISKAIIEGVTAGSGLSPVVTGAITNTNAVAKFEQMMKSMPTEYREEGFQIYCSIDSSDKYNENYRDLYKKYVAMNDNGEFFIDNTAKRVEIKPVTWMGTSARLIATPKLNLLAGVDALGDLDKIHTDQELEILKQRWLFALGFQIRDLEAMRVNDQA